MNSIQSGWFSEVNELWPGQALSLKVKRVLYHERSSFQDILVLESETYGNVLVLDGVIQVTERDEFAYQEMIAHVPLSSHYYPKNVLVVGGGDGGVVREVLKHDAVQSVVLCEIDQKVIEVSKTYLPGLASALSNERVTVHVGDGFEYMKANKAKFDVIITDSSDPVGPASTLFEQPYYACMREALKPGGIVCTQAESIWLHLDLICNMQRFCKRIYPVVRYFHTSIPTYPCGQIGFMLCSLNPLAELEVPARTFSKQQRAALPLRYYNKHIHTASFSLPEFARKALEQVDEQVGAETGPSTVAAVSRSAVQLLREDRPASASGDGDSDSDEASESDGNAEASPSETTSK